MDHISCPIVVIVIIVVIVVAVVIVVVAVQYSLEQMWINWKWVRLRTGLHGHEQWEPKPFREGAQRAGQLWFTKKFLWTGKYGQFHR